MLKYVLFDLDGTLNDSGVGIRNSVKYALSKFNIIENEQNKLNKMIGPPLVEGFSKWFGLSKDDAIKARDYYREYYSKGGKFECQMYQGVEQLLKTLKQKGKKLVVCTSKPQGFTEEVLEHLGIIDYFDFIQGATLDGSIGEKEQVIEQAVKLYGIEKESAIMVGDRHFDVSGASINGIKCVGVTFGFGDREELENAGAVAVVDTIEELENYLLKL